MQAYTAEFAKVGLKCGQVLLTREDFYDEKRYLNARNTLDTLIKFGVVPVINENDAISVDGIKFGDNDTLSAVVAGAVDADGLLILTDIDGLYDSFDAKHKTLGKLVKEVKEITPQIEYSACGTDKVSCVGGMSTKIEAARIATNVGIPVVLANGLKETLVIDFISGAADGTLFSVAANRRLGQRKRWIAFGAAVKGRVYVDAGAKNALVLKYKSLLAPGIVGVDGIFKSGDIIEIVDEEGKSFAKGKVNFSSIELLELKGKRAKEEAVHRDDLVILG
jgi:glutamate 5-kinase